MSFASQVASGFVQHEVIRMAECWVLAPLESIVKRSVAASYRRLPTHPCGRPLVASLLALLFLLKAISSTRLAQTTITCARGYVYLVEHK